MERPAPDAASLSWKLHYILAEKGGCASYTEEYLAQLVTDYRRFLTREPATGEQRCSMTFEGLDLPFNHANDEWALATSPPCGRLRFW